MYEDETFYISPIFLEHERALFIRLQHVKTFSGHISDEGNTLETV